MWKNMWKDYWAAYRGGRLKEYRKAAGAQIILSMYMIGMFLGIYRGFGDAVSEKKYVEFAYSVCVGVPVLFAYFAASVHPVRPEKMLYLCPMAKEERQQYIYRTYFFRVGFHTLLALLGILVLAIGYRCPVLYAVELFVNECLIVMLLPPHTIFVKAGPVSHWAAADTYRVILIGASVVISAILLKLAYPAPPKAENVWMGGIIILMAMAGIEIWPAVKYVQYIKVDLRMAVFYEPDLKERS